MRRLIAVLIRLYPTWFRDRFGAELRAHIVEDLNRASRRGRLAALRRGVVVSGDLLVGALTERVRPSWRARGAGTRTGWGMGTMVENWLRELRVAVRSLCRTPGFFMATVVTLALALGSSAAIYGVLETVLLSPLPYDDADRIVHISGTALGSDLPDEFDLGPDFYHTWGDGASTLEEIAIYNSFTASLRVGDRVERVSYSVPSHSLFDVLGVEPVLGRLPDPGEELVAVLSRRTWTEWFGRDPDVLGRSFEMLDGELYEVVGVMGPELGIPTERTAVWIPQAWSRAAVRPGTFGDEIIARVAPGTELDRVTEELGRLTRGMPEEWGGSAAYALFATEQFVPIVEPLRTHIVGEARQGLWILMASAALVLLIACANVANLFAARAEGRGRDLAVRRAVGAGRGRLLQSQLAEAVVVAGVAGGLGIGLAWAGIPLLASLAPPQIPRIAAAGLTPGAVLVTLGFVALTACVCAAAPAYQAVRPDLGRLRDGLRGTTFRAGAGRSTLVVVQTAVALILMVGSALLVRSHQALRSVDPGYTAEDIFTFQFAPADEHLVNGPEWAVFHRDFMERLRTLPGVESVGFVETLPLDEGPANVRITSDAQPDPAESRLASLTLAGGDYFSTVGIEVLEGRAFTPEDALIPGRAVVSRTVADMMWPGESPLGRTIEARDLGGPHTVVGVVEDVLQYDLRDQPEPLVYYPTIGPTPETWAVTSPAYVVKTSRAETIQPEIRSLIREVAPSAPMYRTFTMEELVERSMVDLSYTATTLLVAAATALLLGALGLYGVLSYVVSRRAREIGVRMALGAESGRVQRMMVVQGLRVVAVGVLIGGVAAAGASRLLSGLLFGVSPLDPVVFTLAALLMFVVGAAASWIPARRASSVDPVLAIRNG